MSNTRKILWGIFGFYVFGLILLMVIYGITTHKNNAFQPQNEFKLTNWVHLGVFSINRAVVYLMIATILTIVTMIWIADRMQQRPNKVQVAVEALFRLMHDWRGDHVAEHQLLDLVDNLLAFGQRVAIAAVTLPAPHPRS